MIGGVCDKSCKVTGMKKKRKTRKKTEDVYIRNHTMTLVTTTTAFGALAQLVSDNQKNIVTL